jgi:N-acetyl-gamma-glutamyl-phosphate reductase
LRRARLIANPGCYATSVILALKPLVAAGLVDLSRGIVADAKSGVSGAGKVAHRQDALHVRGRQSLRLRRLHPSPHRRVAGADRPGRNEITFTPHLLPIPRGILSTVYVRFHEPQTRESVAKIYHKFFQGSPMVRLYDKSLPQIQHVARTCYADLGFQLAPDGRRAVIVSCLDNLLKGAGPEPGRAEGLNV